MKLKVGSRLKPLDAKNMKKILSKPEYVSVADLERFQHYKDRCPPWIKLHWALLDHPGFVALPETSRYHYIMCMLLASRVGNRILNDRTYLARSMRLSEPVDLTPLIQCGLLLACRKQQASKVLAPREQSSSQRKVRVREEKRTFREEGSPEDSEGVIGGTKSEIQKEKEIRKRFPHLANTAEFQSVGRTAPKRKPTSMLEIL